MAYQHLFGSASGGSSGAGYKTLAATEEFYNVMSDDELSNINNYSFTSGDAHPVKFCCYYREYKQCFIQSAVSFEHDYVGRNSSIAHSLVLTEAESSRILNEHICPFSPAMFANGTGAEVPRPASDRLPAVDYRFLNCKDREYNKNVLSKLFTVEQFAEFVLALLLSAQNGCSVFIRLPGDAREASFNAVRLMNILIPAFPAEYRKKMGFMTHVTDTYMYEDISIYFVTGIDLSKEFINGAYCFDLYVGKPYVGGFDTSATREYSDLIRTIMGNILGYDEPSFNDYCNAILPKTDPDDRYSIDKLNEIYFMWKFLSDSSEEDVDSETACSIISSFYDFCDIVDNKAAFINRINGYWEHELAKCRAGGYAPGTDVFDIIEARYPNFSREEKLNARRIWSFFVIYTVTDGTETLFEHIITPPHVDSRLVAAIFRYITRTYVNFIWRKDSNAKSAEAYDKMMRGFVRAAAADPDESRMFSVLKLLIKETDGFFSEMGIDMNSQYQLFSTAFFGYFESSIAQRFKDAGLARKFVLLDDLRTQVASPDSPLSNTVCDHFKSSFFMPAVMESFTDENIKKMAADRKTVTELANALDDYPELGMVDSIRLFRRFNDVITGKRELSLMYELNELVNKPESQETVAGWIQIYNKKEPELLLSLVAHTRCKIGSGGSILYRTYYEDAYKEFYENIGMDNDRMMRELNRFIADAELLLTHPEYQALGLASFREPTAEFVNEHFFDKSINRKTLKENEALLKRYDKVKSLRAEAAADAKDKKKKMFGKK
ncbi:MAG: hypothetical protein K5876_03625 [Ruminiclostridium sp.]|nr:hypothetical protein [Ruminiclostridium sp.]